MTRNETIALLTSKIGTCVRHEYFSKGESIKSKEVDGRIALEDEDGYILPFVEFFSYRTGSVWENGWSVID